MTDKSQADYCVAALYKFTALENLEELQSDLMECCNSNGIGGTILLAREGINGTIAGSDAGIATILAHIKALPGCQNLDVKFSRAVEKPFIRMKVRLKKEIVTMGVPGVDPTREVGTYVTPQDWNELIADPDTIVIDTRNDYEVAIGAFDRAIDPKTQSFREFPKWFRDNRAQLMDGTNKPKVAMYCTGGIRCEKSTAFLKAEGIDEVFHLKGGILKYLEDIPAEESLWRGECFVFDERVSLGHGLEIGDLKLCRACRHPISEEDRTSPHFIEGVSCPTCHGSRTPEQLKRYKDRELQMKLAKDRGEQHLGMSQEDLRAAKKAEKLAAKEAARLAAAKRDNG